MTTEPTRVRAAGSVRPHVFTFHVRFSDIDSFQHVNNVVFVRYLEDARTAMLFADPAVADGERPVPFGGLVVVRHEIDYLRPLTFTAAPVRVETTAREVRAAQFVLDYTVGDDTGAYVRASSVIAAYDVPRGRPRRLTPPERAYLAGYTPTD